LETAPEVGLLAWTGFQRTSEALQTTGMSVFALPEVSLELDEKAPDPELEAGLRVLRASCAVMLARRKRLADAEPAVGPPPGNRQFRVQASTTGSLRLLPVEPEPKRSLWSRLLR
jgi:hypothetical protein